ncbi:MAG: hypothetical protein M3552_06560 [Planctomycetota bacterium]|nr:hypothetical protein [Planctomycetota bacterium]
MSEPPQRSYRWAVAVAGFASPFFAAGATLAFAWVNHQRSLPPDSSAVAVILGNLSLAIIGSIVATLFFVRAKAVKRVVYAITLGAMYGAIMFMAILSAASGVFVWF